MANAHYITPCLLVSGLAIAVMLTIYVKRIIERAALEPLKLTYTVNSDGMSIRVCYNGRCASTHVDGIVVKIDKTARRPKDAIADETTGYALIPKERTLPRIRLPGTPPYREVKLGIGKYVLHVDIPVRDAHNYIVKTRRTSYMAYLVSKSALLILAIALGLYANSLDTLHDTAAYTMYSGIVLASLAAAYHVRFKFEEPLSCILKPRLVSQHVKSGSIEIVYAYKAKFGRRVYARAIVVIPVKTVETAGEDTIAIVDGGVKRIMRPEKDKVKVTLKYNGENVGPILDEKETVEPLPGIKVELPLVAVYDTDPISCNMPFGYKRGNIGEPIVSN